eukprot:scaffold128639_cov29-Prasinocladus_malaysianus.AAC.2
MTSTTDKCPRPGQAGQPACTDINERQVAVALCHAAYQPAAVRGNWHTARSSSVALNQAVRYGISFRIKSSPDRSQHFNGY